MKIGIIQNREKKDSLYYVEKLVGAIKENGGVAVVSDSAEDMDFIYDGADVIISMGGDGTFLQAASGAVEKGIPVLGFNLGTLGLLTEFEKDDIENKIIKIAKNEYDIEERRVIDVYKIGADGGEALVGRALNDCVVSRDLLSGVAYIDLYINNVFVDTYSCDGFVVATQTGSTAYAMSAGGPIVEPGNDVNVVTPICSHSLGTRPIVARPTSTVRLEVCREHCGIYVSIDGHKHVKLDDGDFIECRESEKRLKIVRIDPPNFYTVLRSKFSSRNDRVAENAKGVE